MRTSWIHSRPAKTILLTLAAVFLLLRFVHLTADYPRNIRWDDGIATDEGWYASAAVNQATWGHPYLPGDMNIPVLMPVWSLIANTAFHIGGFHVTSLRATAILFFALCLVLSCILLRRYGAREWIPIFAALLCINPWSFAFSRAAFLEFPMLAFCLLAACLCPPAQTQPTTRAMRLFAAGLCFGTAMLLKTTAIVLAPVLLYVILHAEHFHLRRAIRSAAILFAATALVYILYWKLVIVPHQADVAFYLSVVKSTLRFTPYGFLADSSRPFRYGLGSDHLLFALSLVVIPLSLVSSRLRTLWRDPLFALAAIWMIVFLGFMVKHNNDPARYFAITLPAVLMVAMALLRHTMRTQPRIHQLLLVCIALDLCINAVQITTALLHPAYTYRNAALAIAAIVYNEPAQSPVIIGDEMHEVSLQNGLKPVNLLFHSDTVAQQMDRYNPGWWLQFSPIEDGRCFRQVLSLAYTAERRGEWTIFYPGQQLILWKLTKIPRATLPVMLTPAQTTACSAPGYN